jgi:hypothetical protein
VATRLRAGFQGISVPDAASLIGSAPNAGIFLQPLSRRKIVLNVVRRMASRMSPAIYLNVVEAVLKVLIPVCDIGFSANVAESSEREPRVTSREL